MDLISKIRQIPDFPQKGIIFRDIAPLLENQAMFHQIIELFARKYRSLQIDKVVGIDARGFLFAGALAYTLGAGVIMIRKKGKLPYRTFTQNYQLEYGQATLEIHQDSIKPDEKILLVDDVLATGGTMLAACQLVEKSKGRIIGLAFLVILDYLSGRQKLANYPLFSLINLKS